MLFFLIMIGSAIFVSIFVILVRLKAFERQFNHSIKARRELRERARAGRSRSRSLLRRQADELGQGTSPSKHTAHADAESECGEMEEKTYEGFKEDSSAEDMRSMSMDLEEQCAECSGADNHVSHQMRANDPNASGPSRSIKFQASPVVPGGAQGRADSSPDPISVSPQRRSLSSRNTGNETERTRHPFLNFSGVGAAASSNLRARSASRVSDSRQSVRSVKMDIGRSTSPPVFRGKSTDPFFKSTAGFFSRNSAVHNLSLHERQQLGGCEYSAILVLSIIVPLYYTAWLLLGTIACGAWVHNMRPDVTRQNGLNPFWVGVGAPDGPKYTR